jgi:hypothetical protein
MSSGKNLEFIVMLLIDYKKESEILRGAAKLILLGSTFGKFATFQKFMPKTPRHY